MSALFPRLKGNLTINNTISLQSWVSELSRILLKKQAQSFKQQWFFHGKTIRLLEKYFYRNGEKFHEVGSAIGSKNGVVAVSNRIHFMLSS